MTPVSDRFIESEVDRLWASAINLGELEQLAGILDPVAWWRGRSYAQGLIDLRAEIRHQVLVQHKIWPVWVDSE